MGIDLVLWRHILSESLMIFRKNLLRSTLPIMMVSSLLLACGGGSSEGEVDQMDTIQEPIDPNKSNIVNVGGELFSIPSPVQTTLLIRKLGLGVRSNITNPTANASKYTSKSKKALNMGVYGADLGYMTVFNNSQGTLNYLKVVQGLADELDLTNAFDPKLIKRFNNGMGDEDSLLVIAGEAFRASDKYLKDNERSEVAAMVLAGGWVESFHFSLVSAGEDPDAAIMKRIAEQNAPLDNLIHLLSTVDKDEECTELIAQLKELRTAFADVMVTYHFEQPTVVVDEKTTYINSSTEVELSNEQLKEIAIKLAAIRNSIVA